MIDLTKTIEAKSDQLNAEDFLGGRTLTIKVTKVLLLSEEQPLAIHFEGDNGKPFKPCKSIRRVLVHCWGSDGTAYIGRSMTLYRDDTVTFGGQNVGGIRISHLSNISAPVTISLTATKKSKKPYTVKPLVVAETTKPTITPEELEILKGEGYEFAEQGVEKLQSWKKSLTAQQKLALGKELGDKLTAIATEADSNAL